MKLKKVFVIFLLLTCFGCSNVFTNNSTDPLCNSENSSFSISSTPLPSPSESKYASSSKNSVVRSTFINKTIIREDCDIREKIIFDANDLSHVNILTLYNGKKGKNEVTSATIKINGREVFSADDFQGNEEKITDISLEFKDLQVSDNTLEVSMSGHPGSQLRIRMDGFILPLYLPGAVHSHVPKNRGAQISEGVVGIKFIEGMKVRLEKNSEGQNELVDHSGLSLKTLKDLFKELEITAIEKGFYESSEELDRQELDSETYWGRDVPNGNLFYDIGFDSEKDPWEVADKIRQLPYIEDANPLYSL